MQPETTNIENIRISSCQILSARTSSTTEGYDVLFTPRITRYSSLPGYHYDVIGHELRHKISVTHRITSTTVPKYEIMFEATNSIDSEDKNVPLINKPVHKPCCDSFSDRETREQAIWLNWPWVKLSKYSPRCVNNDFPILVHTNL